MTKNNEEKITKKRLKQFAKFSYEIISMTSEDDIIYLKTWYGVFALNKDRTLTLVSKFNEAVELGQYKYRDQLSIRNTSPSINGIVLYPNDILKTDKAILERVQKRDFVEANAPYITEDLDAWGKPSFRIDSKDSTIAYWFKGEFISYLDLLLGKGINYSLSENERKPEDLTCGALLRAESPNGKAYIMSLTKPRNGA